MATKPVCCKKPGYTRRPAPGCGGGTVYTTLFSNHSNDLLVAVELTIVGLLRASIGPPIMVMVLGVTSPFEAIREIAPNTGTVGWQTDRTFKSLAPIARIKSWT